MSAGGLPTADELADAIAALQKEKKSRVIYIGLFFMMTALFGYFTYQVIIELVQTIQRYERAKALLRKRNARYDLLKDADSYDPPAVVIDDVNYTETIRAALADKGEVDKTAAGEAIQLGIAAGNARQDANAPTCKKKPDSRPFLYYLFSPLSN